MTFDELNLKLSVFLDDAQDAKGEYQFALPLRCDGWNFALDVFEEHTLLERTTPLSVESDGRTAILPLDFAAVGMIHESGGYLQTYVQRRFTPGAQRFDNLVVGATYWLWAGKLHFEQKPSDSLVLDYFAHWPRLSYSINDAGETAVSGDVMAPEWATLPLIHLTAAYCLQPAAIRAAMTRNSNIKIDSGSPEDNSRRVQAREHLWWYDALMSKHPAQVRIFAYGE